MNAIEFENVHRAYKRGVNVLDGVSFHVAPGEVVGLLGRNGAGKTTLIRIAMGFLQPQQGEVRVFGLDPRERPIEMKRRVGYVSEDQILPAHLRVVRPLSNPAEGARPVTTFEAGTTRIEHVRRH